VTSNTSVQDMMLESDSITAKTRGMLNGMRVIDVTYSNDGGCEVTVEVNIDNNGSFLLGALSDLNVKVKDDYPKFDWAAMRKELEQTKTGLAKAKGQLAISQRNLKENRSELEKTREELGDMKSQYAQLKEDFDKKQEELFAANTKLIRAEEKLNYANLRKSDLKDALDTTKTELVNTKMIIDHLQEKLNDKKFKLAVKENELTTAKVFLVKKQDELETLSTDLDIYRSGFQNASLDLAALKGYIYRLKEVQAQTRDQMGIIQPFLQPAGSSVNVSIQTQYTGLLIDARLLHPKPILAPAILNENKEKLYGIGVTFISVTMGSLVNYVTGDIEKANTHDRVGNNPLIVKPIQVVKV
jgi:predicted  nucleic acid-binding Zn-ribbon protein